MIHLPKSESLLLSVDALIEKHGQNNPELLKDLQKHRVDVEDALLAGRRADAANKLIRLAYLIKKALDLWPPSS